MAMTYAPSKLRAPTGWEEMLSGFAKSVLRAQPANIYEHAAAYFEAEYKKKLQADDVHNHKDDVDVDLEDPAVDHAAVQIQAAFRGFKVRKALHEEAEKIDDKDAQDALADIDLEDPELNRAAVKIQASWRGTQARMEVEEMKDAIAEQEAIQEIDLSDPALEDAALKIQASFRGFRTRSSISIQRRLSTELDKGASFDPEDGRGAGLTDIDLTDPALESAAVTIQASFRGFQARAAMKTHANKEEQQSEPPKRALMKTDIIKLFANLDSNTGGQLDLRDFEDVIAVKELREVLAEQLPLLDTNKDGKVTVEELMAGLDINEDGQVSVVEFVKAMKMLSATRGSDTVNSIEGKLESAANETTESQKNLESAQASDSQAPPGDTSEQVVTAEESESTSSVAAQSADSVNSTEIGKVESEVSNVDAAEKEADTAAVAESTNDVKIGDNVEAESEASKEEPNAQESTDTTAAAESTDDVKIGDNGEAESEASKVDAAEKEAKEEPNAQESTDSTTASDALNSAENGETESGASKVNTAEKDVKEEPDAKESADAVKSAENDGAESVSADAESKGESLFPRKVVLKTDLLLLFEQMNRTSADTTLDLDDFGHDIIADELREVLAGKLPELDKNKDGSVDPEEILAALDTNGDGKISVFEFLTEMKKLL